MSQMVAIAKRITTKIKYRFIFGLPVCDQGLRLRIGIGFDRTTLQPQVKVIRKKNLLNKTSFDLGRIEPRRESAAALRQRKPRANPKRDMAGKAKTSPVPVPSPLFFHSTLFRRGQHHSASKQNRAFVR